MSGLTETVAKQIDTALADYLEIAIADNSLNEREFAILKSWLSSFAVSIKQRIEENWP